MRYFKDIMYARCMREDDDRNQWIKQDSGYENFMPASLRAQWNFDEGSCWYVPITEEEYNSFGKEWHIDDGWEYADPRRLTEEEMELEDHYFEVMAEIARDKESREYREKLKKENSESQ